LPVRWRAVVDARTGAPEARPWSSSICQDERRAEHWPSELRRSVFEFLARQTTSSALWERRNLLAQWIDVTAERVPNAHVFSVACDHLREAQLSGAWGSTRMLTRR
jgi:hypothetical protein